jgi:PucR C-terminal helix-turn-helix domain/GGDEF-like domain
MANARSGTLIRQWAGRFRADPLAAAIVAGLSGRADEIWRSAFELLQQESPEYRNSVDDEFARESKSHCNELLRAIVAIAGGRAPKGGDFFGFVRTHAEWRARHHVPLIASLHAYRLAHRIYWRITREALARHRRKDAALRAMTMLSEFWIELFDHVGAVLAEAHAVEERLTAAHDTRTYVGLVDALLHGRAPGDAEAQRLAALAGIRPGAAFAVALVRPRQNATALDGDATLRSLARLIEQVLSPAAFGRLIDVRNDEITAIVAGATGVSRALIRSLAPSEFARRAADGLGCTVGVSRDAREIARLPDAVEEARVALDFATAAQPLMHFSDVDLPEFLFRRADQAAFRLIPDWTRHFAGDGSHELLHTIRAFAACDLNVKQTARRVGVHTNTVYFRLNRIKTLTGVDPRTYAGTSLLLAALRLVEIGAGRTHAG